MTDPIYQITRFRETFLRSDAGKVARVHWVSLPIDLQSRGYQQLLDHFGLDGAAIYGAWCALVCFAAGQSQPGVLVHRGGTPIRLSQIARVTGIAETLFEKLFAWATTPAVAWIEIVTDPDTTTTQATEESEDDERGVPTATRLGSEPDTEEVTPENPVKTGHRGKRDSYCDRF